MLLFFGFEIWGRLFLGVEIWHLLLSIPVQIYAECSPRILTLIWFINACSSIQNVFDFFHVKTCLTS